MLYEESSGLISSPFYPDDYLDALHCNWTIKVEGNLDLDISFDLSESPSPVHLEEGSDYLRIFNTTPTNMVQLAVYVFDILFVLGLTPLSTHFQSYQDGVCL